MKQTKDIIEQMVRAEIGEMLGENREVINEVIKTSFLPEFKAEVRNSILLALEDLLKESSSSEEITLPEERDTEASVPESMPEKCDDSHPCSEISADTCSCGEHVNCVNDKNEEDAVAESGKIGDEAVPGGGEGRYLYCIVESKEKISLGKIGIDGNEVYTIPYKELAAVVHNCPAEPYNSDEQEVMTNWVMTHQQVTDAAWEKFGSVLPFGFDTIIQQKEDLGPDENTKKWMEDDYDNLKDKFEKIKGKAEYGVQVLWNPKVISQKINQESPEIKALQEEMNAKPKGIAYMYRQKLENLLKTEMEKEADRCFKDFYEKIKRCVDDIKVEKTKKAEDGKQMLLNLTCLIPEGKSEMLGDELETINNMEGFTVRFTGPWPPYGFV